MNRSFFFSCAAGPALGKLLFTNICYICCCCCFRASGEVVCEAEWHFELLSGIKERKQSRWIRRDGIRAITSITVWASAWVWATIPICMAIRIRHWPGRPAVWVKRWTVVAAAVAVSCPQIHNVVRWAIAAASNEPIRIALTIVPWAHKVSANWIIAPAAYRMWSTIAIHRYRRNRHRPMARKQRDVSKSKWNTSIISYEDTQRFRSEKLASWRRWVQCLVFTLSTQIGISLI